MCSGFRRSARRRGGSWRSYIGFGALSAASGVPRRDRPIDMVFQNLALLPYLHVAENVAYGLKAPGVSRQTTPASQ